MFLELKQKLTHDDPECPGGPVEESEHKGAPVLECSGCNSILYRGVSV